MPLIDRRPRPRDDRARSYPSARAIPRRWDETAGDDPLLARHHLELVEACHPELDLRYHSFADDTLLVSFRWAPRGQGWRAPRRATVLGLPTACGGWGLRVGPRGRPALHRFVRELGGLKIALPTDEDLSGPGGVLPSARLPAYELGIRWGSFEDYLGAMRSGYRRRARVALRRCGALRVERLPSDTSARDDLYAIYLQVYRRAAHRLLPLHPRLLAALPGWTLAVRRTSGPPLAFARLISHGDTLVFFKGGLDYAAAGPATADIYSFLLLQLVRAAIEGGYRRLDLGKSAATAKLRIGCRPRPLCSFVGHSNPILHRALAVALWIRRPRVSDEQPIHRVFRQAGH